MCGLDGFKDAIVGSLGVEMMKRTTIGVELAAKVRAVSGWSAHCRMILSSQSYYYSWTNLLLD